MADQEFLASFGVDIDEGGVARLQQILSENRTLAQSLADSFNAASESIRAFKEEISTDLPSLFSGTGFGNVTESLFGSSGGLTIGLDMTEPRKEISSFTADAKKPIALAANASGIVSAARTALESVRSLFSETFTINVRASTSTDGSSDDNSSRTDSRNRDDTGTASLKMSAGGRFTRPTSVEVAEDGDAEYIIPVKKEGRALPLLRRLLSELSPEARQSLTGTDSVIPEEADSSLSTPILPDRETAAAETSPPVSAQSMFRTSADDAADLRFELLSSLKDLTAAGKEPAPDPAQVIPDLRQAFAEADHPLASAPAAQKDSLPSAADSPKQNLSELVSQMSAVMQPGSSSVTNTSNNLSAPVTINVNARGSDAEQIGRTIYDTAERYLLRTMKGVFA